MSFVASQRLGQPIDGINDIIRHAILTRIDLCLSTHLNRALPADRQLFKHLTFLYKSASRPS